ncbi:hypothetical protein Q4603_16035 [Zobellia galactanivorans]|uniref:hypothetical protein n=1 Tax=Zobellia galactanivorans (strain DSM 12802 / CCUG 47099 / CIP 106680 / NCIMB 13871 / Dsij) TaxID=63186 RepID=UPI001C0750FB|nr:hypothetical protein [Zobellia galactanivorans]MBU3026873.1 hypothetical protein [Zobellia galactanivorans]MDO6810135.1 hypothetical protein [Zobellia galactanivorans]
MRNLTVFLLFMVSITYSQTAEFGNLTKKSEYKNYKTKSGYKINIGDTLALGIPSSDLGFAYISQNGQRVSHTLAGKPIVIDKLKTYGNKKSGYKMYAQFKGYGLLPVLIDYETALELGEIKNPDKKITREQAIAQLKEAKELLDLEVITQKNMKN